MQREISVEVNTLVYGKNISEEYFFVIGPNDVVDEIVNNFVNDNEYKGDLPIRRSSDLSILKTRSGGIIKDEISFKNLNKYVEFYSFKIKVDNRLPHDLRNFLSGHWSRRPPVSKA